MRFRGKVHTASDRGTDENVRNDECEERHLRQCISKYCVVGQIDKCAEGIMGDSLWIWSRLFSMLQRIWKLQCSPAGLDKAASDHVYRYSPQSYAARLLAAQRRICLCAATRLVYGSADSITRFDGLVDSCHARIAGALQVEMTFIEPINSTRKHEPL